MLQLDKITGNRTTIAFIILWCVLIIEFSNGVIFTSKREKDEKGNVFPLKYNFAFYHSKLYWIGPERAKI